MLPIGRASIWLFFHLGVGLIAVGVFWSHTRSLWPKGFYEELLAASFYGVSLSGIVGYLLERIFPKRLTRTGIEVIFERIPAEMAGVRKEAETLMSEHTEKTQREAIEWFFRGPRFFFSHAFGSQKGSRWIQQHLEAVKRNVTGPGFANFDRLAALAEFKNKLDIHYALQKILKSWLWFHVPLTLSLGVLIVWHVVIVYVYVL